MRSKIYRILFGYTMLGIYRVVFSAVFDIRRYVGVPIWILFAYFTDKKVVPFIIRGIVKRVVVEIVLTEHKPKPKKKTPKKKITK